MSDIHRLEDVQPGDIMFGPIGGLVGAGVGLGQIALGDGFHVGHLAIRHVGIVVEASRTLGPSLRNALGQYIALSEEENDIYRTYPPYKTYTHYPDGVITAPRLVQAMPSGAEEIEMRYDTHWTNRHAYVRLPEDYPGQARDAAAIARLMVAEGVAYSFASYAALSAWRFGVKTPRLERWIGRRRQPPYTLAMPSGEGPLHTTDRPSLREVELPVEAICSVLVDQAWSLAGARVVEGTAHQAVTPGMMAGQLWRRPGVVWGGLGLL